VRKIVFVVMGLLALFTILRAYGEQTGARFLLEPGALEISSPEGTARIAFGLLERTGGTPRTWSLLPIRVELISGRQRLALGLNGLSLLSPGGIRVGRPLRITGQRQGDVICVGGKVTVLGTVHGDVWTFGADVQLGRGAVVTGNVVALGGRIRAEPGAVIRGNKYSLPNVKLPLLRLLSSGESAATFRFLVQALGVLLYLLLLFLAVHFAGGRLAGLVGALASQWKGAILYLVLAVFLIPIGVALLVATILGIVLVPFVAVAVMVLAYLGFLGFTVRLGMWMRGLAPETQAGAAYTSGLLGLLVIKGPVLLGILLGLLSSDFCQAVGRFLFGLGAAATIVSALYGFGGTLRYLRSQAGSAA
jgi:hypothetical protein